MARGRLAVVFVVGMALVLPRPEPARAAPSASSVQADIDRLSTEIALLFLTVSIVFGVLLSMSAIVLEELTRSRYPRSVDVLLLFIAAIVENFGFRQLLTVWRTRGLIDGLRGKQGWGAMERRGFSKGAS
jgi:protein-S-isoprenylcysteine O-methyltransferase Ste14